MAFFLSSLVFLLSDFLSFNGPLCRYHDERIVYSIQHGKVLLAVPLSSSNEQREIGTSSPILTRPDPRNAPISSAASYSRLPFGFVF